MEHRKKWFNTGNIVCKNLFVKDKEDSNKITDLIEYYDPHRHNIAIIDENNDIKRTFKMGVLVDAVYANFKPVSGIEIKDNKLTLKGKYKNGKIDDVIYFINPLSKFSTTKPITDTDLIDFSTTSGEYILCSNLPLHLQKIITFLFFIKPIDMSGTEALFNFGNVIDFYRNGGQVVMRFRNDVNEETVLVDDLDKDEINIIGVSYDEETNKLYCYESKVDKDPTGKSESIQTFTLLYPWPFIPRNNQIEIAHNQDATLNNSFIGSFYCSTKLHNSVINFERLEWGVERIEHLPDFDNIEEDHDKDNRIIAYTKDRNIVKLDKTLGDLNNLYNSYNQLPNYLVEDGQLKLSTLWTDGIINYPVNTINVINDNELDFTNNVSNSYIEISNLPLVNFSLITFAFRFKPIDITSKEAIVCYGTDANNRIEFYKDNNLVMCSLYNNGSKTDIIINQSGLSKTPLFWYNFVYNGGVANIGNSENSVTDRIGGNITT